MPIRLSTIRARIVVPPTGSSALWHCSDSGHILPPRRAARMTACTTQVWRLGRRITSSRQQLQPLLVRLRAIAVNLDPRARAAAGLVASGGVERVDGAQRLDPGGRAIGG
jgi:hypothetical protein